MSLVYPVLRLTSLAVTYTALKLIVYIQNHINKTKALKVLVLKSDLVYRYITDSHTV